MPLSGVALGAAGSETAVGAAVVAAAGTTAEAAAGAASWEATGVAVSLPRVRTMKASSVGAANRSATVTWQPACTSEVATVVAANESPPKAKKFTGLVPARSAANWVASTSGSSPKTAAHALTTCCSKLSSCGTPTTPGVFSAVMVLPSARAAVALTVAPAVPTVGAIVAPAIGVSVAAAAPL